MNHKEWFDKRYPELRLPGNFIRKASGKIEVRTAFGDVMGERFERWLHSFANAHRSLLNNVDKETRTRFAAVLYEDCFTLSQYVREREHSFRLTPSITELLMGTELPEVISDDLQLPFRAFYIDFPPIFSIRITPESSTRVAGAYVVDLRPHEDFFMVTVTTDSVTSTGAPLLGMAGPFALPFEPGAVVHWSRLHDHMDQASFTLADARFAINGSAQRTGDVTLLSRTLTTLIFNTVFYATSASPDLTHQVSEWRRLRGEYEVEKNPKRRRKLEEQMEDAPRTECTIVGRSIQVAYGRPTPTDDSDEAHEDRKVLARFEVRGHWRNQVHGAGRKDRKRIFIAPYWKGPADIAELLRRKYVLK